MLKNTLDELSNFFSNQETECILVVVKATRKPIIYSKGQLYELVKTINSISKYEKFFLTHSLCVSGISYMIFDSQYEENIKNIEIGSPTFYNIPSLFQHGGY